MSDSYRYPGVRPFTFGDARLFFGRKTDINRLVRYLKTEDLVVLHGKSGLGKSSLINAGILPFLQKRKDPYTQVKVRFNSYNPKAPRNLFTIFNQSLNRKHNLLDDIPSKYVSPLHAFKSWEYANREEGPHRFLLILDQFEELFTYPQAQVQAFSQDLANLYNRRVSSAFKKLIRRERIVNNALQEVLSDPQLEDWIFRPVEIKILIAIRSDKFNLLDRLSEYFPEILVNSRILEALNRSQAKDAIANPAGMEGDFESPSFSYSGQAMDKILDFLSSNDENQVEGFQLQIVCRSIEERVMEFASGKEAEDTRIQIQKSSSDTDCEYEILDVQADFGDVLRSYYDEKIREIKQGKSRLLARQLIEDQLIADRRRVSLDEAILLEMAEGNQDLLDQLVNTRIIRREPNNLGGLSYEISHDTLLAPIIEARTERKIVEDREQKRQEELELQRNRQEELQRERDAREKELAEARAEQAEIAQQTERRNKYFVLTLLIMTLMITAVSLSWWWNASSDAKELEDIQDSISGVNSDLQRTQEVLETKFGVNQQELEALHSFVAALPEEDQVKARKNLSYSAIMAEMQDTLTKFVDPAFWKVQKDLNELIIRMFIFERNGKDIRREGIILIEKTTSVLNKYPDYNIAINVHTDRQGDADVNLKISYTRALMVLNNFLNRGLDPERITISGKGESEPIPGAGPDQNRRVDIVLSPR